jgi:hypothetical protein
MRRLLRPFLILLALVFLFEAWLWRHLAPIVGWVVARIPWAAFKVNVAAAIERLPPYPTLLVFLIPVILLLPLKVIGFWMLAHGFWLGAIVVFTFAKMLSLGVTAFIFDLTRPKLLQLSWFRQFYDQMIIWLAKAHEIADPVKERIRRLVRMFAPNRAGRTFELLSRIRRRMQAARDA